MCVYPVLFSVLGSKLSKIKKYNWEYDALSVSNCQHSSHGFPFNNDIVLVNSVTKSLITKH